MPETREHALERATKHGFPKSNVAATKKGEYYIVPHGIKEKVLTEQEKLKAEVEILENQTGYTRVLREIILKTDVSKEAKAVAEKIERVAIKLRK